MKYMGSKRSMLQNGLGELICQHAKSATRIVDLFCGAGSVSWFAAEKTIRPVLAVDLQLYAVTLAQAVVARVGPLDHQVLVEQWLHTARRERTKSVYYACAKMLTQVPQSISDLVRRARALCALPSGTGPVWNAYGGHYFSPLQALTFDYLLKCLPDDELARATCHAALISAASKCAASPGHTAQPLQPTTTAEASLRDAWTKDPLAACAQALNTICGRYAHVVGEAIVADALTVARNLNTHDLVIVDPPYSDVQYSRFYHVLETIARGESGLVEGVGRYPDRTLRPQSDFSKRREATRVLEELFTSLAKVGATVIVTFPAGEASNGLSGATVTKLASVSFDIEQKIVKGRFSTLGGKNDSSREARAPSSELLLVMKPG